MIITFKRRRYWRLADGTKIPLKDAPESYPIVPNQDDIQGATKCSPCNCMYARYWKRTIDPTVACINRDVAFGSILDKNGKLWVLRMIVTAPAKHKIEGFDGGEYIPPHGVTFAKPTGSRTLEAQALAQALWQAKKLKQQVANERKARSNASPAVAKEEKPKKPKKNAEVLGFGKISSHKAKVTSLRRSGSGMFQFPSKPAKIA